jgi:hypothetical protein
VENLLSLVFAQNVLVRADPISADRQPRPMPRLTHARKTVTGGAFVVVHHSLVKLFSDMTNDAVELMPGVDDQVFVANGSYLLCAPSLHRRQRLLLLTSPKLGA